jgi:DNA-binding MarR family transcriptional regulator
MALAPVGFLLPAQKWSQRRVRNDRSQGSPRGRVPPLTGIRQIGLQGREWRLTTQPQTGTKSSVKNELAEQMADLTYELLENCQLKIERTARKLNLTVAEFKLIRSIRDEEKLSAGELARRMGLSSSRITRIIDGLVKKGIAQKESGGADRRVVEIQLTTGGKETRRELKEMYVTVHRDIIDRLPSDAGQSVILAMEKLREATEEWIKE